MGERWRAVLKIGLPLGLAALLVLALWMGILHRAPPVQTTTRMLMGTLVSISTWGMTQGSSDRAVQRAFAEMDRIEEAMSWHRPTSEVSRINQVSRETWIPISAELGQLVQRGLVVSTQSGGAFSIGLEPLTTLWGFSTERVVTQPPAAEALRDWLQGYPSTDAIVLREGEDHAFQIYLKNRRVGLDLGSIGKGHAIDQAIAVLRQEGVTDAVVDAGGDLRILGSKGGVPWRIGLQDPRQPDQVVAVSLLKGDMAMATSGDYERFFIYEGRRYHHIMDPTTAAPAQSGLSSVSVQAANSTTANSLATAIFVLGPEKGLALLAHFPGSEVLMITEAGQPIRSPGFIGEWLDKPQP